MHATAISRRLQASFEQIHHERMADMPILNDRLSVQTIGFQSWQGHWLGVLVTPWFMNLMLLPGPDDDWGELRPGSKHDHIFPSGHYEFIVGEEDGVGSYQSCSLFSPVFEFESQAAAVATAEAALRAVMDADNGDAASEGSTSVKWRHRGRPESEPAARSDRNGAENADPSLGERMDRPMTRRDLLRGVFLQRRD
jgi:[NiFe] hydrogenase assembly HybE family chaperone